MKNWSIKISDTSTICSGKKLLIKLWSSKDNSWPAKNIRELKNHCEATLAQHQIDRIEQTYPIEAVCTAKPTPVISRGWGLSGKKKNNSWKWGKLCSGTNNKKIRRNLWELHRTQAEEAKESKQEPQSISRLWTKIKRSSNPWKMQSWKVTSSNLSIRCKRLNWYDQKIKKRKSCGWDRQTTKRLKKWWRRKTKSYFNTGTIKSSSQLPSNSKIKIWSNLKPGTLIGWLKIWSCTMRKKYNFL